MKLEKQKVNPEVEKNQVEERGAFGRNFNQNGFRIKAKIKINLALKCLRG